MNQIKYYPSEIENKNNNKPVLILFGFLQSNFNVLLKYRNLYKEFDSFLYIPPMDISTLIMKFYIKKLVVKIHNFFTNNGNSKPFTKDITLHGISIGTGGVAIFLRYLKDMDNGKYNYLFPMIKSIVLDSGFFIKPDDAFSGFRRTFKAMGGLPSLIPYAFPLVKPFWKVYFKKELPVLLNINCNILVIHGSTDDFFPNQSKIFLNLVKDIDENNNNNNNKRIILQHEFPSGHCKHFKNYPEEYEKLIRELILISKL